MCIRDSFQPVHIPGKGLRNPETVAAGERDGVSRRIDVRDKDPPPRGKAQATALAEGISVDAPVPADHLPGLIQNVPRRAGAAPALQPGGIVPIGDKADLHACLLYTSRCV